MNNARQLRQLAERLAAGETTVDEFLAAVQTRSTAVLPDASLDVDRHRRCGFPEVVFGEGKSAETLSGIFRTLLNEGINVFATRVDEEKSALLVKEFPAGRYNRAARTFRIDNPNAEATHPVRGFVAVISAGTSDLPIAEEARETLDWMGIRAVQIHDVGVAGPHRLPERLGEFQDADAIVVVAGMEGALPSVVGGYVSCPVFAVPTSVGYGASFGGVAALLGMLNSCAANVAVVNIEAGFKAAYLAGLVASRVHKPAVVAGE